MVWSLVFVSAIKCYDQLYSNYGKNGNFFAIFTYLFLMDFLKNISISCYFLSITWLNFAWGARPEHPTGKSGTKKILHFCFFNYGKHRCNLCLENIAFLVKLLKSAFCYFCYNLSFLLLGCQKTYLWFQDHFSKDNYSLQKCRKM